MITKIKKNKSKSQFLFFSFLFGFLFLLIISFLIFSNLNLHSRRVELIERIEILRNEIQILKEKNQKLQSEIKRAEQKDFLEEKAREELGLKRPGEEVVVILSPSKEKEKPVEKNFWEIILEKFGF
jgi:cell division protein FtsL